MCDETHKSEWVALNPDGDSHTFFTHYTITIGDVTTRKHGDAAVGGSISAAASHAAAGDEVTLTATPTSGYAFVSWTIEKTSDNSDVTTTVLSDNTLTMPAYGVTVKATFAEQFTIVYKDEDKTTVLDGLEPTSYLYGTGVAALPTPTKTGYTFDSWYNAWCVDTKNGGSWADECRKSSIGTTDYSNVTYYASWTANVYTVTLNTNSGTINSGDVTSYTYGEGATLPTDVTRDGYRFEGWFDNSGLTDDRVYTIADNATENKAYWAKWVQVYTITKGSPTGGTITVVSSAAEGEDVDISANANIGYGFSSWSIYKTGTPSTTIDPAAATATTTFTMPAYAVTVDATFEVQHYSVTYNANGGSGSAPTDETSYSGGATVTVLGKNTLTKSGYTFTGWNTASDYSGVFYPEGYKFSITSDVTLYAVWEAEGSATTYYYGSVAIANGALTKGTTNEVQFFTYESSTFANSTAISLSSTLSATGVYSETNNVANWLNASNWTTSSSSNRYIQGVDFAKGGSYTLALGTKVATSITFVGLSSQSQPRKMTIGGVEYSRTDQNVLYVHEYTKSGGFTGNVTITQDGSFRGILIVTCAATSTNYTVAFDNGGHGDEVATLEGVPSGSKIPDPGISEEGNTLTGWYTESTFENAWNFASSTVTADKTLYAKWSKYSITYHLNGGSWTSDEGIDNYAVGTGATLPDGDDVSRATYTFAGWYANSDLSTGGVQTSISSSATGDKEYWAKWTEVEYTVSYDKNGGTGDSMDDSEGHIITIEECTYTKEGKVFSGWNTEIDGSGDEYHPGDEVSADLTLYAQWANDYTISWGDVKLGGSTATPNLGGGGYTIVASVATWTGSLTSSMVGASDGVTITDVTVDNSSSQKTATVTFNVGADVEDDEITFTIDVPANGTYLAKSKSKDVSIERCEGSDAVISIFDGTVDNTKTSEATRYKQSAKWTDATTGLASTCQGVKDGLVDVSAYTNNTGKSYTKAIQAGGSSTSYYIKLEIPSGYTASLYLVYGSTDATNRYISINSGSAASPGSSGGNKWNGNTNSTASKLYAATINDLAASTTYYITQSAGNVVYAEIKVTLTPSSGSSGDPIEPSLEWDTDLSSGVAKEAGDVDFTHTASVATGEDGSNTLGTITYSSSNTSVATINSTTGKVHVVGAGTTIISASLSESGCYESASTSYTLTVTSSCDDVAGTISTDDQGCDGIDLTVSGHTAAAGVTYQWYKVDSPDAEIDGATSATYRATEPGEYYVIVTNTGSRHCAMVSTNTVVIADNGSAPVPNVLAGEFTVKNERPFEYRVLRLNDGETCTVKSTTSWEENTDFELEIVDNIVTIRGYIYDDTPGTETVTLTVSNGCNSTDQEITIHKIAATTKPTIAWVATGTKGVMDNVKASESTETELYQALMEDYTMTPRNCYWTTNEADLIKEYSKYDLIILTDYPNSKTGPGKSSNASTSYTNAFGLLIDHKPILTFEAYVAGCPNWGIPSNPTNTSGTVNTLTLLCNASDIFDDDSGKFGAGEEIDVSDVADGQALQGFAVDASPDFVFIAKITDDADNEYVTCCERQVNTTARMMVFGLNGNTMNNMEEDGIEMVKGFVDYLLLEEEADIPDCSVIFNTEGDWNNTANWEGGSLPDPYATVRIDKPCTIPASCVAKAGHVKIHVGVGSGFEAFTGSLTIAPQGVLVVEKGINRIEDNKYTYPKATEVGDILIQSGAAGNGTLIMDNRSGHNKATVQMYSKAYTDQSSTWYWQYIGTPHSDVTNAMNNYYNSYLYKWNVTDAGWDNVPTGASVEPWVGYCITHPEENHTYTMEGTLVSTSTKRISIPAGKEAVLANSWTAPIYVAALTDDDFGANTKTIFLFNTGSDTENVGANAETITAATETYVTIPIHASPYTGDSLISSMQGFFIYNESGSASTLTLDYNRIIRPEGNRNAKSGPMHIQQRIRPVSERPTVMKIFAKGSLYGDKLVLLERQDFSPEYDDGWDGEKRLGNEIAPALWTVNSRGTKEAVTATNDLEGTTIGFRAGADYEYTFLFEYDATAEPLYLLDLETQVYTCITEENTYTFTCNDKAEHNRFILTRNAPSVTTGTVNLETEAPKAIKVIYNDKLYIIRGGRVYSADGQLVK